MEQSIPRLLREQRIFKAAVNLMYLLGTLPWSEKDEDLVTAFFYWYRRASLRASGKSDRIQLIDGETLLVHTISGDVLRSGVYSDPSDQALGVSHVLYYLGHWKICELLKRFPPVLTFFAHRGGELPQHRREGILPALYFMLRQDYMAEGERLGICANEDCRAVFAITRHGKIYCSIQCSQLQRQRDYWRSKGSDKRRNRMRAARAISGGSTA